MIIDVYRSSCKVLLILVRFECNLNFLGRFSKIYSDTKFYVNLSSGRSRVVPRGQTDMTKLTVAFR